MVLVGLSLVAGGDKEVARDFLKSLDEAVVLGDGSNVAVDESEVIGSRRLFVFG